MFGLVRPKAVMPVHGEFRMLAAHARLARDVGRAGRSIVLAENGSVVELRADGAAIVDRSSAASPSSTGSASATSATSRSATGGTWPRTAC